MGHSVCCKLQWTAAHRLINYTGPCAMLHGHFWTAEIHLAASLNPAGMSVDFSVIKKDLGGWIDKYWDHGTLVSANDKSLLRWLRANKQKHYCFSNPTAEVLSVSLYEKARELFGSTRVLVSGVTVSESPKNSASFWSGV